MSTTGQVFISHVFEERAVAAVLQKYILQAFNRDFRVFAAFDNESIGGGKKWFDYIINSLAQSDVVLVLLSADSNGRQWINFEAGYGAGCGAEVIPVSIRNFSLGRLQFPLAGFQGRSIDNLPGIIADVANRLERTSDRVELSAYLEEIRGAEAKLIYRSLRVKPFVARDALRFELTNAGNIDAELLMLEALVPRRWISPNWPPGAGPFLHANPVNREGHDYVWFAVTSNRGSYGSKTPTLRPVLTPTMGTIEADGLSLPLAKVDPMSPEQGYPLHYQLHAVDFPTEMESTLWADVEFR